MIILFINNYLNYFINCEVFLGQDLFILYTALSQ